MSGKTATDRCAYGGAQHAPRRILVLPRWATAPVVALLLALALPAVAQTGKMEPGGGLSLEAALASLAPQRPERTDLYVVGMAGDGSEQVFAHEVRYLRELFAQRFDTADRSLTLINSDAGGQPDAPEASLDNLSVALAHIGGLMDPEQDLLLLFLTSHGSRDHEFYIRHAGEEGVQIRPEDVRAALDEAGIAQRIVVISACYSGGFIPALADPDTLVITAARHDRTSFGCGVGSRITYFGEAFLAGALNETEDFVDAFRSASRRVTVMEKSSAYPPSQPQMAGGENVLARLERWRDELTPGPALPYTADGKHVPKRR